MSDFIFLQKAKEILNLPSPLQTIEEEVFEHLNLKIFVKRDDLIHPVISGNKWRKLKYNLLHFKKAGYKKLLTFGGAFSNHIYAAAAAGKHFEVETIGIIRGDELNENASPILKFAADCGMKLIFTARDEFRAMRENPSQHAFIQSFEDTFVVPEGGTNEFALEGVGEMVEEINEQLGYTPDYILCPVGTGGTISGIIASAAPTTKVIGVCALKNGQYLEAEINHLVEHNLSATRNNYEILWDYHHGGYAKKSTELTNFVNNFNIKHSFSIEPIYSGKLFFAFYDLLKNDFFQPGSTVVLIHTGGVFTF